MSGHSVLGWIGCGLLGFAAAALSAGTGTASAGVTSAPAGVRAAPPLPSQEAAAAHLAESIEQELRYPEESSLDTRTLACFAPAEDLRRLRKAGGLESALREAFFKQEVRLL